MIIGISGKIGAGKDLTAKIIQVICHLKKMDILYSKEAVLYNMEKNFKGNVYYGDWHVRKFAGKLKQIVSLLTGISIEDLEKQEVKDSYLGEEWNYCLYRDDNYVKHVSPSFYKDDEIFKQNPERFTKRYKVRDLLQILGTEALRNVIHENVHVNALFADYPKFNEQDKINFFKKHHVDNYNELKERNLEHYKWIKEEFFKEINNRTPNWIISDLRFENEYQSIKDRDGICIRINREDNSNKEGFILKTRNSGNKLMIHQDNHPSETALDKHEFDYVIDNTGTIEDLIEKVKEILIQTKII